MEVKIPTRKPSVIDTLPNSLSTAEEELNMLLEATFFGFMSLIDMLFWWCVDVLQVWGELTGLGYNLINILIFVLLQPFLILLFFILWFCERTRRGRHHG
jgi:hypothetical protein